MEQQALITPFKVADHQLPFTVSFEGLPMPARMDAEWDELFRDAQTGKHTACYYVVCYLADQGEDELAYRYANRLIDAGCIGALDARADLNEGLDAAVPDLLALAALGEQDSYYSSYSGDACMRLADYYEAQAERANAVEAKQAHLQAIAVDWHKRAAVYGIQEAYLAVGLAYEEGLGVPQDYVEATRWYCNSRNALGDPSGLRYNEKAFPVDLEGQWWDYERLGRFLVAVESDAAVQIKAMVAEISKATRMLAQATDGIIPSSRRRPPLHFVCFNCKTCSTKVWGKPGLWVVCGECQTDIPLQFPEAA